ncbi:MAG: hypothetical protein ACLR9W_02155 [Enterobacter hormaechei]
MGYVNGIADDEKGKSFTLLPPRAGLEDRQRRTRVGAGRRCSLLMKVKYGMQSIEGKGSRFWMRFNLLVKRSHRTSPFMTTQPRRCAMRRCTVLPGRR